MYYCIIAAGEGSRLRKEGFESVKPLVKVKGEYLIERLIRIFRDNNAEQITIIINEESKELEKFLNSRTFGVKINLVIKSTPSSLHSFWNIIHNSNFTECCLTTVDTIFNEKDFKEYISKFVVSKDCHALMGITKYIDDEKPLYVKTNKEENRIEAYLDKKEKGVDSVSAGIYCLRKEALHIVDDCIEKGVSRMRNYQRALLENNLRVEPFLFGKVIDIDHLTDIAKAEQLIENWANTSKILAIYRQKEFSPNSEDKDTIILNSVVENLKVKGYSTDSIKEEDFIEKNSYDIYNKYSLIISMARSERAISILADLEKNGTKVVNSTLAIKNCFRAKQTEILQQNNISIPETFIINTNNYDRNILEQFEIGSFWIKRADFQTIKQQDVCLPKSKEQVVDILSDYKQRNIDKALISKNIEGDVIKFYGIRNSEFFYYYYPTEDKFHNKVNTSKSKFSFDEKNFISQINKVTNLLELDIYGGDAIIDKKGQYFIIDINDFPSFSSCKEQASKEITNLLINKL
ncbi:MAG: NDP-sugar synthase [Bacteroidota bacterium]|nr:NDP-sugar synthase [Bacteroidota bacterium]